MTKKCWNCDGVVTLKTRQFCCQSCFSQYSYKTANPNTVDLVCMQCGKAFTRTVIDMQHHATNPERVVCSKKCHHIYLKEKRLQAKVLRPKPKKVYRTYQVRCTQCGKVKTMDELSVIARLGKNYNEAEVYETNWFCDLNCWKIYDNPQMARRLALQDEDQHLEKVLIPFCR